MGTSRMIGSCIVPDIWLGDMLKRDAFRLDLPPDVVSEENPLLSEQYLQVLEALRKPSVFVYSKVPTENIAAVRFLEKVGFNLIDTNVVFEKPRIGAALSAGGRIRLSKPEDRDQVVLLARTGFK